MTDKEFREWLRYSRYQQRNQITPDRPATNHTQAELNKLHGLPEDFTPPTEEDVSRAVDEVLSDIAPHRATPSMNRGKTMLNPLYETFNVYGSISGMSQDEQDIFTGLCRSPLTDGDTARFSPKLIFMLLKTKRAFNAEDLSNWLNIKRKLCDVDLVTVKHARAIIQKLQFVASCWSTYGFIKAGITYEDYPIDLEDPREEF